VNESGAIDNHLHEVTASTMTLNEPANSVPPDPIFNFGGVLFNLIDVAQGYTFVPSPPVLTSVVSRKTHGTLSPPGDLVLTSSGPATIEPRTGGIPSGNHTLVFSFVNTLNAVSSVTATATTSGGPQSVTATGSIGTDTHQYIVNLTGVPNASHVNVTLNGVTDSTLNSGDVPAHMDVLLGDVSLSGRTDAGDVTQVRNRTVSIPDTTDPASFRFDVNASGRIDAGDVTTTRNATVTVLPP
jgi:dockerin type I repeat protein